MDYTTLLNAATAANQAIYDQLLAVDNNSKAQLANLQSQIAVLEAKQSPSSSIPILTIRPDTYFQPIRIPDKTIVIMLGVTVDGKGAIPHLTAGGMGSTVIGGTYRGAAPPVQDGAIQPLADSTWYGAILRENKESGMNVRADRVKILNCLAVYNGRSGIRGGLCTDVLVDSCELGFNNTDKFSVAGDAGGGKWAKTNRLTVKNCNYHNNYGPGLWLDTENQNYLVDGGRYTDHQVEIFGAGIIIEISHGPGTVQGVTFQGNYGPGINVCESMNVTIKTNTFIKDASFKNGGNNGVWIRNQANREIKIPGWTPTGQMYAVRNLVVAADNVKVGDVFMNPSVV